ncbi:PR domain zinc finger protein 1 [Echinococcus granulosus]|nr:PR domain zinc finger protein 1 [Echinococcus granulosus]
MFTLNANEPEDLSILACGLQHFASFSEQKPSSIGFECNYNLQSFFSVILERCKKQQLPLQHSMLPSSKQLEYVIHKAILECLPTKNCNLTVQGEITICIDSAVPVAVKLGTATIGTTDTNNPPSTSKRKSYQPMRIRPTSVTSPTSHSPDSGALDLSRAASIVSAESAPPTPFKGEAAVTRDYYEGNKEPGKTSALRRLSAGGRRIFSCNQCSVMEFRSLQHLEVHTLEVHGGYRCHVCHAKFTQRSNLQRHALKHVGFKPFQCRLCGHGYYRKDHLMRHMEVLHPNFSARENIDVYLTSSQSLDYLNNTHMCEKSPRPMQEQQHTGERGIEVARDPGEMDSPLQ